MKKLFYGSNAKGRRKLRRRLQQQGKAVPAKLVVTKIEVMPKRADNKAAQAEPDVYDVPNETNKSFPVGSVVRIATEDYGKSYKNEKATVLSYDDEGKVIVQVRLTKRKTPLTCNIEHLVLFVKN